MIMKVEELLKVGETLVRIKHKVRTIIYMFISKEMRRVVFFFP